jgi:hypothetical protein
LEASRASRKRAWENLQEIRWILKNPTGTDLPPAAGKTIDLEGRVVKEDGRKIVNDRQISLQNLVHAISEFRKFTDQPLTLRGSDYAHAVQELNKAVDRANDLLQFLFRLVPLEEIGGCRETAMGRMKALPAIATSGPPSRQTGSTPPNISQN